MKRQALIVLITLTLCIIAPPSLSVSLGEHSAILVTLDVCNTSAPAVSSTTGQMPCVFNGNCCHNSFDLVTYNDILDPHFTQLLLPFHNERPPRA